MQLSRAEDMPLAWKGEAKGYTPDACQLGTPAIPVGVRKLSAPSDLFHGPPLPRYSSRSVVVCS